MTGQTVVIYGASDDLVEVEGNVPGCDEYNTESASFVLVGAGEIRVRMAYRHDGTWEATLAKVSEDIDGLPVRVTFEGYTARVEVERVRSVHRYEESGA